MNPKTTAVLQSKTMWLNIVSLVVVALNTVVGWEFMPEKAMPYLMLALSMANMALRFLTNTPMTLTGSSGGTDKEI